MLFQGEDSVAFAVFIALCFSIALTTLITRWGKCPLPGALVGIVCLVHRIPERPREGWSEADIMETRGRSTSYSCLKRRESMYGVIFKLELLAPLLSAEGVRTSCTPVE